MKNKNRNSGYSLVELMVTLGLSTIVSMGASGLMYQQVAAKKNFERRTDIRAFERNVKQIVLRDKDACSVYFNGQNFNLATAAAAGGAEITLPAIEGLSQFGGPVQAGLTFAQAGFQVNSLRLQEAVDLGRDSQGRRIFGTRMIISTQPVGGVDVFRSFGAGVMSERHIGSPVLAVDDPDNDGVGNVTACYSVAPENANQVCDPDSVTADGRNCSQWYSVDDVPAAQCGAQNPFSTGIVRNDSVNPPTSQLGCDETFTLRCPAGTYLSGISAAGSPARAWLEPNCQPIPRPVTGAVEGPVQIVDFTSAQVNCNELADEVAACQAMVQMYLTFYCLPDGRCMDANYCSQSAISACYPAYGGAVAGATGTVANDGRCQCGSARINPGRYCQRCHMQVTSTQTTQFSSAERGQTFICPGGGGILQLQEPPLTPNPNAGGATCSARYETW